MGDYFYMLTNVCYRLTEKSKSSYHLFFNEPQKRLQPSQDSLPVAIGSEPQKEDSTVKKLQPNE